MSQFKMTGILAYVGGFSRGVHHFMVTRRDGSKYEALIMVQAKNRAFLMKKPEASDMYSSWSPITDHTIEATKVHGQVYVWAARDKEFMKQFDDGPKYALDLRNFVA